MSKNKISLLAESVLFNRKIDEGFGTVDKDKHLSNTNKQIYDRPGPSIRGDGEEIIDDIIDLPVAPSEIVPILTSIKGDALNLLDKNYSPHNKKELMSSVHSLLNDVDMSDKEMNYFWQKISKYLGEKLWTIEKRLLN